MRTRSRIALALCWIHRHRFYCSQPYLGLSVLPPRSPITKSATGNTETNERGEEGIGREEGGRREREREGRWMKTIFVILSSLIFTFFFRPNVVQFHDHPFAIG